MREDEEGFNSENERRYRLRRRRSFKAKTFLIVLMTITCIFIILYILHGFYPQYKVIISSFVEPAATPENNIAIKAPKFAHSTANFHTGGEHPTVARVDGKYSIGAEFPTGAKVDSGFLTDVDVDDGFSIDAGVNGKHPIDDAGLSTDVEVNDGKEPTTTARAFIIRSDDFNIDVDDIAMAFDEKIADGVLGMNSVVRSKEVIRQAFHGIEIDSLRHLRSNPHVFQISFTNKQSYNLIGIKGGNAVTPLHSPYVIRPYLTFKSNSKQLGKSLSSTWYLTEPLSMFAPEEEEYQYSEAQGIVESLVSAMKEFNDNGYLFEDLGKLILFSKRDPQSNLITELKILNTGELLSMNDLNATDKEKYMQNQLFLVANLLASLRTKTAHECNEVCTYKFYDDRVSDFPSTNDPVLIDLWFCIYGYTEFPPRNMDDLYKHWFISGKSKEPNDPYGQRYFYIVDKASNRVVPGHRPSTYGGYDQGLYPATFDDEVELVVPTNHLPPWYYPY